MKDKDPSKKETKPVTKCDQLEKVKIVKVANYHLTNNDIEGLIRTIRGLSRPEIG